MEGPILATRKLPERDEKSRLVFFLKYEARSPGLGYAVLGRLVSLKADNAEISALASDRVYIYVGIPLGYPYRGICVAGTWADRDFFRSSKSFQFTEKDLELIQSDAQGKLFKLPRERMAREVDPRSIVVTMTASALHLPPRLPHYHLLTRRGHRYGEAR